MDVADRRGERRGTKASAWVLLGAHPLNLEEYRTAGGCGRLGGASASALNRRSLHF